MTASGIPPQVSDRGVTLLEIVIATVILGLVTGGIFAAFVFARSVSYRSNAQLVAFGMTRATAEDLRINAQSLAQGIYVDEKMRNAGAFATQNPKFFYPVVTAGGQTFTAIARPELNFPDEPAGKGFRSRYQTNPGTAQDLVNHGDGRVLIVEETIDIDGDGQRGLDLNNDTIIDLKRVRIKVKYTPPTP